MSRTPFLVLLLAAVLVAPCFGATEYPILDKQVEIRHAHLAWIGAVQEVRMQAAISYIDTISAGQGTQTLITLSNTFKEQVDNLQSLTTHAALDAALVQSDILPGINAGASGG